MFEFSITREHCFKKKKQRLKKKENPGKQAYEFIVML